MEHHQTVARPYNGIPGWWDGWWATVWCVSINFQLQILILKPHQIFKISYFHKFYESFKKNYLSLNIPKNHQKNYETGQSIDTWEEQRDSSLLETQTRYLLLMHAIYGQPKYDFHVHPRLKRQQPEL